jgi:FtsP/CotA-like multicopper oxidase with cupredoxin domain
MMALPGETLNYAVEVPPQQPPGLYWYHTHSHGESYVQDLDGMSGAIVVEGIDRVTGPPADSYAALRSRCFDPGPDGDSNPAMTLAPTELIIFANARGGTPFDAVDPNSRHRSAIEGNCLAGCIGQKLDFV